jgi:hypothetical protein
MPLLQSVLTRLSQTKKPQQTFLTHLLGLMLMLPGHATFRHLSGYSPDHERTFARWYARDFDLVSLNKAAITAVVPAEHEQALVMDASFVPKSGQKTYGLDHFWNGYHSRTEQGLEISALAWSISRVTAPTASASSRHPQRAMPSTQRLPGWMAIWSH